MSLHENVVAELSGWTPPTSQQADLKATYLTHLNTHPDGLTRECHPDHLTASLLVVDSSRERVLLNLHAKYRIWVQFGGHCEESDATLAGAALREGAEESGIDGLVLVGPGIAKLSRHEVSCGPVRPSHHLDVRYVAVAPPGAAAVVSDESLDVRWFGVEDLPPGLEREVRELVSIARRL